jgi:hypothetical protein
MGADDTAWHEVCDVDVEQAVAALGMLVWHPIGKVRPRFAMIKELKMGAFPWPYLVRKVMTCYPKRYKRKQVFLSNVLSGQRLPPHTDGNDDKCEQRVHVPLKTNPGCRFTCDGEQFHMEVGKAYEINPTLWHGVENFGSSERIHLMFNVGLR